jgi:hypothetical protein
MAATFQERGKREMGVNFCPLFPLHRPDKKILSPTMEHSARLNLPLK